jgi:ribose-phosphate pyrophosphokinase
MSNDHMMLFTGNANLPLAQAISETLNVPLGKAKVGTFSDGECQVEILENVRGADAYIVQSTCAPSNDNLMELMLLADALRRASVNSITAVIPYFGYARQDRRVRSARVPITAKVVADMLATVGISRVVTVDLHADQIQGFFYMPVDNVYASPILLADLEASDHQNLMVVSPDVGGVVRARAIAKRLNDADLAIIDKRRPRPNESQVMNILGDVSGKSCIIVDDIVDTAGTLCMAAQALKDSGATKVSAYCTHPVLSGPAVTNIQNSVLDELVVTDTLLLNDAAKACRKIRQISLAGLLSESIRRINGAESLSSMFPE